jgi:uncharacterized hydrophobic protein (TIGR00271 family)
MSNDQTVGEKIKQKSYIFLLSVPHVPRHSAAKNLGLFAHRETFSPVLKQINSRSGVDQQTSKNNKRATALLAVNEGLKADENESNNVDDSNTRSFAEGVQDILQQNIKYITTPMWLPNLPPSVIKEMVPNGAETFTGDANDDTGSQTESKDSKDNGKPTGGRTEVHGMVVIFTTQYVELILKRLSQFGVGQTYGTVSIFPTSLQRHAKAQRTSAGGDSHSPTGLTNRDISKNDAGEGEVSVGKEVDPGFISEFVDSINSRVIVEEVIENVRSAAVFSFDYLLLVIVASMIAGVGLAINSTVAIVASMLVSPIMGPILAITFGMTTKKTDLIMIGIRSELISLFLCILIGFIISLVFTAVGGPRAYEWPTPEMAGRGKPMAILESVFIALPSGIGVALSVLGNNTSSLVGVAISASLLPPAVNTGMLLGYAMLEAFDPLTYSEDLGWYALYSFLLTVVNIAIIILMALLFFWIKEVVSIPGDSLLWSEDIQVYKNTANVYKKGDKDAKEVAKLAKLMAAMGGKKGVTSQQQATPTPAKARRRSVVEIFAANSPAPLTPGSAKANAALNAFTVAQQKGENPHYAMVNALTQSHLSSRQKDFGRKRTAASGLFNRKRKGKSFNSQKSLHPIESLANVIDVNVNHVNLANVFDDSNLEEEELEVFGGTAHQSTHSIFDPVTPSQRINDKTSISSFD